MSFRFFWGCLGFGFFLVLQRPELSCVVWEVFILVLRTKDRITEILSYCLTLHSIDIPCNKSSIGEFCWERIARIVTNGKFTVHGELFIFSITINNELNWFVGRDWNLSSQEFKRVRCPVWEVRGYVCLTRALKAPCVAVEFCVHWNCVYLHSSFQLLKFVSVI